MENEKNLLITLIKLYEHQEKIKLKIKFEKKEGLN